LNPNYYFGDEEGKREIFSVHFAIRNGKIYLMRAVRTKGGLSRREKQVPIQNDDLAFVEGVIAGSIKTDNRIQH